MAKRIDRNMKITIIGPSYPYRGGIAQTSDRLAKALQDEGHGVELVTFTLQYPSILFPGKTQLSEAEKPKGLEIIRSINSINPISWWKTASIVAKQKTDLVIFASWMPFIGMAYGTIAKRIKRKHQCKIISLVHNLIPHEKRPVDNWFNRYFAKHMEGFVAMSKSVMKDLDSFEPNKPKLFSPLPLFDNFGPIISKEKALQELGLDPSIRYMLFFGLVRSYKGLDILINALGDERLNKESLKLIIAGEFYEEKSIYLDLIAKNKLDETVIIIDKFIPDDEVANYFCAADIIVQPYRDATQSAVTQVAYHFEKPILVTDVGGLKETVPHHKVGYVAQPNPKSVSDAIIDFYENDREQEFVAGVKDEKLKFSWKQLVDAIMNIHESV